PVVLTGAQLPMGRLRTDGRENLITALEIAAARREGQPVVKEVAIYFESRLLRGNRSHKYNTEDFDAFESANYPALANVGVHIFFDHQALFKPDIQAFRPRIEMSGDVAVLRIFPGINERLVRSVFEAEGLKGIVLETFGSGNAPTQRWFSEILRTQIDKGLVVVNISQCNQGFVEQGRYQTSLQLERAGVTSGADMTIEAAITKLMFLIGAGYSPDEIRRWIQTPMRGELTNYSSLI
ncbi:MAG: L-asparaginase 1, partial [Bacteroidota bacterium]